MKTSLSSNYLTDRKTDGWMDGLIDKESVVDNSYRLI